MMPTLVHRHLRIGLDRVTTLDGSRRRQTDGCPSVERTLENLSREVHGVRGELVEQFAELGDTLFESIGHTPQLDLFERLPRSEADELTQVVTIPKQRRPLVGEV